MSCVFMKNSWIYNKLNWILKTWRVTPVKWYISHKYPDKWMKIGVDIGICLGNNQGNFQLHKFTRRENTTKSFMWGLLFLTHIVCRMCRTLLPYSVQKTFVSELPVVALLDVQTQWSQDNYVDNLALLYILAESQPRVTAAQGIRYKNNCVVSLPHVCHVHFTSSVLSLSTAG